MVDLAQGLLRHLDGWEHPGQAILISVCPLTQVNLALLRISQVSSSDIKLNVRGDKINGLKG